MGPKMPIVFRTPVSCCYTYFRESVAGPNCNQTQTFSGGASLADRPPGDQWVLSVLHRGEARMARDGSGGPLPGRAGCSQTAEWAWGPRGSSECPRCTSVCPLKRAQLMVPQPLPSRIRWLRFLSCLLEGAERPCPWAPGSVDTIPPARSPLLCEVPCHGVRHKGVKETGWPESARSGTDKRPPKSSKIAERCV